MKTALLLLSIAVVGCAPTYANGYQEALARGLAAQNAGRYDEAATAFRKAGELGDRYKDRDEARLLEGHAYERLRRYDDAEKTYAAIVREGGGRYQAVRAEFARARLVTERRGHSAGDPLMLGAVKHNPSSGLSRHAVVRMLEPIEEEKGPDAAIAWLRALEPVVRGTDLEEAISYEEGLVLFRASRYREALVALVACARAHPYPRGSLTDDAYYQASLLAEELGDVDQAIALLREMLEPSEAAYAGSSYERPRFPQGQLRIGALYRDKKHDRAAAKRELRAVCARSATRFCDDALWSEGRLEVEDHEGDKACETMHLLAKIRPESRYVACGHALCSSIAESTKCREYILRDLRGESPPDAETTAKKLEPAAMPQ